jgi:hypothetical protein
MHHIFFKLQQHMRTESAVSAAESASNRADRLASDIRRLQRQVDRLSMSCQAMWELIRENSNITEEMLEQRIREVDLRDGVEDGKMGPEVVSCPTCGRKTNTQRGYCVICGAEVQGDHAMG